MSHLVGVYNAFHTAAAAKALTGSYVAGTTIQQPRPANTLRLSCTLAWTVIPTNVRVVIRWTRDGTNWTPVGVVNSVTANVVDLGKGEFDLDLGAGTASTHEIVVGIPPGCDISVQAKMTDPGGADPTLLAVATLTDE